VKRLRVALPFTVAAVFALRSGVSADDTAVIEKLRPEWLENVVVVSRDGQARPLVVELPSASGTSSATASPEATRKPQTSHTLRPAVQSAPAAATPIAARTQHPIAPQIFRSRRPLTKKSDNSHLQPLAWGTESIALWMRSKGARPSSESRSQRSTTRLRSMSNSQVR
jgi:hypothetical protein